MERLMGTAEVADLLGVSPEALRVWRHRGEGPRAFKYARRVMYRAADVEQWLETKAVPGPVESESA
ncbi:helix-turn-helix transcriptional regulator [Aeromicrobium sp. CnD17-E]|uniref:helix-turn-helix transcriptional regulator n=1 Tax=Aeromicrobium sp. CnD17-E TaxID=2954487 RepID=UPI0035AC21A2